MSLAMRISTIAAMAAALSLSTAVRGEETPVQPSPPASAARGEGAPVQLAPLVAEAIANHPRLQGSRQQAKARWQVPSQVASPPDPFFAVDAQNIRFDDPSLGASPMSAIQLGLVQRMPYPGKLSKRHAFATAVARASDRSVELLETRIALEVQRAYWRLSYAEDALRIVEESETVINTLTNTVHARFSVAMAPQQDALQAQVAHSRVRAMLAQRRQLVDSARRTLNAAVGRPPSSKLGPVEPPPRAARPLDRNALMRRLRRDNPSLSVSRAQVYAAKTALASAKAERWPDFQAGFMYRLRLATPGDPSAGADMFGVTLGVTLPVWMSWKQNAGVRQANALRLAAADNAVDVDLAESTALQRAVDEVLRLDEEIRLYDKEVVPQADAALNASIEDYAFDRVGFVSLLQNWQTTLDAALHVSRLRATRAERLAEIDALIGRTKLER